METVRAAGAVLWLPAVSGDAAREAAEPRFCWFEPLVALVHRPKYDDWSLPKGKLAPGEEARAAALREVREETGLSCVLGAPLPTRRYPVQGRVKEVRYWAGVPVGGSFAANREVDRLEWLPASVARARLTHDHDRVLVDALLDAVSHDQA
ncbi:NUDIX hydrolase [Peterkaempfera bronchialis]|uniref:NUDIX hydrolase n=1 Tax=Peterkaempfera bronchialis TaxID=2126346 RepID=A0A345SX56_9ACTN|nr:NUDIX hydrolase [Peterkaempfera bronchialis]AXI78311.1 NUDIX hydrolase [Peterkaempfera bronchialis]